MCQESVLDSPIVALPVSCLFPKSFNGLFFPQMLDYIVLAQVVGPAVNFVSRRILETLEGRSPKP